MMNAVVGRSRGSVDYLELFRQRAEIAEAAVGYDDQVLDPYPELPRQVDARLDGDDFSRREEVVGALREARALVHLEPDPVAEGVPESLAVAGLVDDLAGGGVGVLPFDPGADRLQGRGLGAADDLVDRSALLAGVAGGEGAGAVRAVAVELGAHGEDDELAAADLALARLGVRQSAVGAGGDDRRERGIAPELADPGFGGAGHVALAAAGKPLLQGPAQDLVSQLRGLLDRRQLPGVLDPPQILDLAAGGDQLGSIAEFLLQFPQQADRHLVVFETDLPLEPLGDPLQPVPRPGLGLPARDLGGSALGVAEIGQAQAQPLTANTSSIRAGEPGQVADVGQLGDEEAVEPGLGQQRLAAVAAGLHQPAPSSRASSSSASRYPSGPLPATLASTKPSKTESRRQSSRASTSER